MAFSQLNTLTWVGAAGSAATASTKTVVIEKLTADGAVTVTDGADNVIKVFASAGEANYNPPKIVRGLKRDNGAGVLRVDIV